MFYKKIALKSCLQNQLSFSLNVTKKFTFWEGHFSNLTWQHELLILNIVFHMQLYSYLLFNFPKFLELTYNCLIRINQVFHWLKKKKRCKWSKKIFDWYILFLEYYWDAVIPRWWWCYHREKFPLIYSLLIKKNWKKTRQVINMSTFCNHT